MWGVFHPSQQLNCCHNVGSGCFRLTRLAISLRSVSAITAHFKLSREVRGCIVCGRVTLPHDVYFTCGICEERHDVCVRCYDQTSGDRTAPLGVGPRTRQAAMADHPMHRDVLPLLVDTAPLGLAKSSADCLARAFALFGPRPCLGTRQQALPGGDFGEYSWMTYDETFRAALAIGTGLMDLLETEVGEDDKLHATTTSSTSSFVGVLGAVCADWLISDIGCALKGLPVVLMHRATYPAQLAHMLHSTNMRILVLSRHLAPILAEALRIHAPFSHGRRCADAATGAGAGASLRHVVWLDDSEEAHPQVVLSSRAQRGDRAEEVVAAMAAAAAKAKCGGGDFTDLEQHRWSAVLTRGAAILNQQRDQQQQEEEEDEGGGGGSAARNKLWSDTKQSPDAIVKLLPSSGTTGGAPKLTVVTEGALRERIRSAFPNGDGIRSGGGAAAGAAAGGNTRSLAGVVVVFAYEAMRQSHDVLLQGGRIGFFSGALARIEEDCQRLRPTAFAATPTFWMGLLTQFEAEVRTRRAAGEGDALERTTLEWMERRVLGNRLQVLLSTGAPLPHRTCRWLFRVFGRTVVDAYGTTETGGLATNGVVSAGAEVRLLDCPQLGYSTADKPHPRGEILAHSRAPSYFTTARDCAMRAADGFSFALPPKKPSRVNGTTAGKEEGGGEEEEEEEEEEDKDWVTLGGIRYFRTGDIGELVGKGQIRVIDRCKSYFKLQQGVFVAPHPVEEVLQESPYVRQIFVWGASTMRCVSCVVVICPEQDEEDSAEDDESLQLVEERVLASLRSFASKSELLKPYEVPQRVVLEREPFSEGNGLVSANGKLCRPALVRKYRDRLLCVGDGDGGARVVEASFQTPAAPLPASERGLCAGLRAVLQEVVPIPGGTAAGGESALSLFRPDCPLLALGLDSLGVARLSSRLEATFGVALTPRVLYSLPTLGDVEAALFGGEVALRRSAMRANLAVDWQGEVDAAARVLDRELAERRREVKVRMFSATSSLGGADGGSSDANHANDTAAGAAIEKKDTIFLTGATGFLGAFLLDALVAGPAEGRLTPPLLCHLRRVVCLVRATDDAAARARLKKCLSAHRLWSASSAVGATDDDGGFKGGYGDGFERRRRLNRAAAAAGVAVSAVAGDLEAERMGLDAGTYHRLASRVRRVIHCAARVDSALPFRALREANVGGTVRALALAHLSGADFVHVSTMGFLPLGHGETRSTSADVEDGLLRRSGYGQSKWVAEQVVSKWAAEGSAEVAASSSRERVPSEPLGSGIGGGIGIGGGAVVIVRPGAICGSSATGASNLKDATSVLLCGCVAEGAVCALDPSSPLPRRLNLCPVDFVAAAIVAIASLPREVHAADFPSAAFHLCARASVPLTAACDWLRAAGYQLEEVSAAAFCARSRKAGEDHPLFPLKSLFAQPAELSAAAAAERYSAAAHEGMASFATPLADKAIAASAVAAELPMRSITEAILRMAMKDMLTRTQCKSARGITPCRSPQPVSSEAPLLVAARTTKGEGISEMKKKE